MSARTPASQFSPLHIRLLLTIVLLAVAACLPLQFEGYVVFQLTMVLVWSIALLGLNIVSGYCGQISIGHGAFYALGSYVAAVVVNWGAPWWVALPCAAALCFVAGVLFGFPALRLQGHYLALATFALAIAVPQLLKHQSLERWTGGVQGVSISPPAVPSGIGLSQDQYQYYLVLAITVAMTVLARNLVRGRFGLAMQAVRNHPLAASALGVDTAAIKIFVFGLSALYTGVAGALAAMVIQFVAPDSFGLFLSITLLVGIVVGGLATISGAFFGAIFVQFVPSLAEQISKAAPWAVYGACLLLIMFVLPGGISGGLARIRRHFSKT